MNKLSVLLAMTVAALACASVPAGASKSLPTSCGGGTSFNKLVAGWQAHGVLNDVMSIAKIDPTKSGSIKRLRAKLVLRTVAYDPGIAITDYGCAGGKFVANNHPQLQPPHRQVWVLEADLHNKNPFLANRVRVWWPASSGDLRRWPAPYADNAPLPVD